MKIIYKTVCTVTYLSDHSKYVYKREVVHMRLCNVISLFLYTKLSSTFTKFKIKQVNHKHTGTV